MQQQALTRQIRNERAFQMDPHNPLHAHKVIRKLDGKNQAKQTPHSSFGSITCIKSQISLGSLSFRISTTTILWSYGMAPYWSTAAETYCAALNQKSSL